MSGISKHKYQTDDEKSDSESKLKVLFGCCLVVVWLLFGCCLVDDEMFIFQCGISFVWLWFGCRKGCWSSRLNQHITHARKKQQN